mmetsp:Transcript_40461/g.86186  ORF Transcript_40461/g.86186 Transcript_40461/m.86186 type:complete len:97 (-) Transcript_40461:4-294(-)
MEQRTQRCVDGGSGGGLDVEGVGIRGGVDVEHPVQQSKVETGGSERRVCKGRGIANRGGFGVVHGASVATMKDFITWILKCIWLRQNNVLTYVVAN